MYPSDYGYATSGGSAGRDICLATALQNWAETNCYSNDWLYNHIIFWTLTSYFNINDKDYIRLWHKRTTLYFGTIINQKKLEKSK